MCTRVLHGLHQHTDTYQENTLLDVPPVAELARAEIHRLPPLRLDLFRFRLPKKIRTVVNDKLDVHLKNKSL